MGCTVCHDRVRCSHLCSLENYLPLDEEAMEALWPTLAKILWKRQSEHVERHH